MSTTNSGSDQSNWDILSRSVNMSMLSLVQDAFSLTGSAHELLGLTITDADPNVSSPVTGHSHGVYATMQSLPKKNSVKDDLSSQNGSETVKIPAAEIGTPLDNLTLERVSGHTSSPKNYFPELDDLVSIAKQGAIPGKNQTETQLDLSHQKEMDSVEVKHAHAGLMASSVIVVDITTPSSRSTTASLEQRCNSESISVSQDSLAVHTAPSKTDFSCQTLDLDQKSQLRAKLLELENENKDLNTRVRYDAITRDENARLKEEINRLSVFEVAHGKLSLDAECAKAVESRTIADAQKHRDELTRCQNELSETKRSLLYRLETAQAENAELVGISMIFLSGGLTSRSCGSMRSQRTSMSATWTLPGYMFQK